MTTRAVRRTGLALQIALAVIAIGAISWMGVSSVWPSHSSWVYARYRIPPTAIDVEASLGSLGLTPKVLTAAGFSPQQTSAFAAAAAGHMRANFAGYRQANDAAYLAANEVDRLTRLIQGGRGSPEGLAALATAQASLNSARAQRQAILDAALAEGGEEVPAQARAKLNLFRAHKLLWQMPERYLGDERSEAQWVELRDALANEDIAARQNAEPDPAAHQIVLTAQGTLNSAAAAANLVNLAEITAAWNAAMHQ